MGFTCTPAGTFERWLLGGEGRSRLRFAMASIRIKTVPVRMWMLMASGTGSEWSDTVGTVFFRGGSCGLLVGTWMQFVISGMAVLLVGLASFGFVLRSATLSRSWGVSLTSRFLRWRICRCPARTATPHTRLPRNSERRRCSRSWPSRLASGVWVASRRWTVRQISSQDASS